MKFLRRVNKEDYITDQTIGVGGGTVTDVPDEPSEAIEVEIEGRRYVILAYETKN